MAPSIFTLMRCSRPVPLAEKHPRSRMFPPPCFHGGDGVLGVIVIGLFVFIFVIFFEGNSNLLAFAPLFIKNVLFVFLFILY